MIKVQVFSLDQSSYSKEEIQKRKKEILDSTSDPIEELQVIYNYTDPLSPFDILVDSYGLTKISEESKSMKKDRKIQYK